MLEFHWLEIFHILCRICAMPTDEVGILPSAYATCIESRTNSSPHPPRPCALSSWLFYHILFFCLYSQMYFIFVILSLCILFSCFYFSGFPSEVLGSFKENSCDRNPKDINSKLNTLFHGQMRQKQQFIWRPM